MRLSDLTTEQPARICTLPAGVALTRRLRAMGLRPGVMVQILRQAPLGDPLQIAVGETSLALRHQEAEQVLVELEI